MRRHSLLVGIWIGLTFPGGVRAEIDPLHVILSPDASLLAGAGDGILQVRNVCTGETVMHLAVGGYPLAFDPANKQLAFQSSGRVDVFDLEGRALKRSHPLWSRAAFGPDGKLIALVRGTGRQTEIRVAGVDDDRTRHVRRFDFGEKSLIDALQFNAAGDVIAIAASEKNRDVVVLWDLRNDKVLHELVGHEDAVLSTRFSSDGRRLATASMDETIVVWDVARGTKLRTLRGHLKSVDFVTFTNDDELLVSTSYNSEVKRWNVDTGRELPVPSPGPPYHGVVATNGSHLAWTDGDAVRVLNLRTGANSEPFHLRKSSESRLDLLD